MTAYDGRTGRQGAFSPLIVVLTFFLVSFHPCFSVVETLDQADGELAFCVFLSLPNFSSDRNSVVSKLFYPNHNIEA